MTALERFFAIVERELGAERVEMHEAGATVSLGTNDLLASLPDGAQVVARFARPHEDRDAAVSRLRLLIDTFGSTVRDSGKAPGTHDRTGRSIADALHEELRALAERARATDVFIIDAHSPVVWGAATVPPPVEDVSALPAKSREALAEVRALSAMDQLAKGRHLRHIVCRPDGGYAAHSFASIYLVVVVYDALYDELRAERAVLEALTHVESLVLALPPFDPEPPPHADVIAIRRRRR